MKRRLPCICCVLGIIFIFAGTSAPAQKQYNIWYFGKEVGLDFNSVPPQKIAEPPGTFFFDIQTMADRNTGQLLFYFGSVNSSVDSLHFRNADHERMANSPGPRRHYAYYHSSSIIVPRPGYENQYYAFYRSFDELHKLYYSLVDMDLNGGKGDVAADMVDVELDTLPSYTYGALTATGSCARNEYWLVARDYERIGSKTRRIVLKAYRIGRHGIDPAVNTELDEVNYNNSWGTLKFSPSGRMLAFTDWYGSVNAPRNFIFVYNFDQNSGRFSLAYELKITDEQERYQYGGSASFSPDNSKLYASMLFYDDQRRAYYMKVMQFDMHAGSEAHIQASRTEIAHLEGTHHWGHYGNGMQIGPDQKIYMRTGWRPIRVSVIHNPNAGPGETDFEENSIVFEQSVNQPHYWHNMPNIIDSDVTGRKSFTLDVKTGADTTICAGEQVQLPAWAEGATQLRWDPPTGLDNASLLNPTAKPLKSTTYTLTAWNGEECTVSDTLRVNVLEQPDLWLSGDTTVCPGSSVQLAAGGARYYSWSPAAGLSKINGPDPKASPDTTTTYTVWAYDDPLRRCGVSDTITVRVAEPPQAFAGEDIGICRGDIVQLRAGGGTQYLWTPGYGLSDRYTAEPLASPETSTRYIVTVSNEAGCSAVDTLEVFVSEPFDLQLEQREYTICLGTEVQLRAGGADEYRWFPEEGLSDPTSPAPQAKPLKTTTYTLIAAKEHCSVEAQVTVFVNSLSGIEVTPDTSICQGESLQLWVRGGERYEWSGPGLDDANSARPLATPDAPAEYIVKVYNMEGCYGFDTVRVGFRETLELSSEQADYSICAGESVRLGVSGAERYEWTPKEGLDNPDSPNPIASPSEPTIYTVTAWKGTCSGTLSIPVHVNLLPEVSVSGDAELCAGEEVQLRAAGGEFYRWEPSDGLDDATSPEPIARPETSTRYRVTATSVEGCEAQAEVYVDVRAFADVYLSLPDTVLQPGDILRLPLTAETAADALPVEDLAVRLRLSYPPRMMSLRSVSNGSMVLRGTKGDIEDVEIVTEPTTLLQANDTLAFLEFGVFMTSQEEGQMSVEEPEKLSGRCIRLSSDKGTVTLGGVCLPYSLSRLVPLSLGVVSNPARGQVEVRVRSSSREIHELSLYDSYGRSVWRRQLPGMPHDRAERSVHIPAAHLAAGIYYLQARNADQVQVVPVMLGK